MRGGYLLCLDAAAAAYLFYGTASLALQDNGGGIEIGRFDIAVLVWVCAALAPFRFGTANHD